MGDAAAWSKRLCDFLWCTYGGVVDSLSMTRTRALRAHCLVNTTIRTSACKILYPSHIILIFPLYNLVFFRLAWCRIWCCWPR